jgi:hypothetical protein
MRYSTLFLSTLCFCRHLQLELSWLAFPRVTCDCSGVAADRADPERLVSWTLWAHSVFHAGTLLFLLLELSNTQVPCSPTQEDYCWSALPKMCGSLRMMFTSNGSRQGRNVHENHMIPGPGLKIATAKKLARSSPNCGLDTNHETITYVTQPTHRAPAVSRAPGAPQDDRNHATRSRKAQTGRPA